MKTDERAWEGYYRASLYCFLPNVCNARCDFCYMNPRFGVVSHLPTGSLARLEALLVEARRLRFDTIRLTGGEPLILDNLDALVEMIVSARLSYTVLTNGILLPEHTERLIQNRPRKITISMHGLDADEIFQSNWPVREIAESVGTLRARGLPIEVTLVFDVGRRRECVNAILEAARWGVDRFRIVASNTASWTLATWLEMGETVADARSSLGTANVEVRSSNPHAAACELLRRGRLSLTLPQFDLYPCCVQVGDQSKVLRWDKSAKTLETVLWLNRTSQMFNGWSFRMSFSYGCLSDKQDRFRNRT